MAPVIKTRIVKIGNSQGIRIPKIMLEQVNFEREVELEVEENRIIIRPIKPVRAGWENKFKAMSVSGDDRLLDEDILEDDMDIDWEW